jgi:2-polyprenyl-3-methyl-5-hydroxy-6-metoxy-1,4-benzoquinol methylase
MEKQIVYKVEPGMDVHNVLCTTYQMRNFYSQFRDGFFSNLDVMNYIQHHAAAKMAKKGWRVVDVCCGRSLILPLLRWYSKNIASYTGVDISATNIKEAMRGASKKLTIQELRNGYYPFRVAWKQCNVAEMSRVIEPESTDFVVYTSAIEHMHKDVGLKSLYECHKIMKHGGTMFLSCPNTPGNGYDTQYAAHVYEWGYDELKTELDKIGFKIKKEVGLVMKVKNMEEFFEKIPNSNDLKKFYNSAKEYVPKDWLTAFMSIPFPKVSQEILFIVEK